MFLLFCFLPYFWLLFVSRSFRLDHSHQCMNKTNNNRSPFTNISETSREILIFFSNLLWQQQILHWCVARSLATRKQSCPVTSLFCKKIYDYIIFANGAANMLIAGSSFARCLVSRAARHTRACARNKTNNSPREAKRFHCLRWRCRYA